jgi:tetratricopeptide (TPR) repeat protein
MDTQQPHPAAQGPVGDLPHGGGGEAVDPSVDELLQAGVTHHRAGRLAEAEMHYRRVLATAPDRADALHLLGVVAYQVGFHAIAIELIAQAIQLNGNNSLYYSNRGLALQGLKRLDEALASYDRGLALAPGNAEIFNNRGLALAELKRFAEALESYERGLAIKPDYAEALNNRGNALRVLGRFTEALESYERALALRPSLAEAYYNRGDALRDLGRPLEAVASYDRALALKADYPEALINRGLALHQLGRFGEALASYERALALRPEHPAILINCGLALHQLNRFAEAVASYDRVLAGRPDYAEALINRGLALHQLERFAEAVASYERALALRPDRTEALVNRGLALHQLERLDEALESYDRALALCPDDPEALNDRGLTLHDLGRFAEAVASYDRALASRPDFADTLNNRGLALQNLKRFEETVQSFDRALAIDPEYRQCQLNRAHILLRLGNFDEGWQKYEWRRKTINWTGRPPPGSEWDKGDPVGKRLLFYSEQGLGDTIQFCRLACSVAARGAEVLLQVPPPLRALLSSLQGVKVIRQGEPLPEYDAHFPLMSLPSVLGSASMAECVPYLFAEPARIETWAKRLPVGRFRVGIVWQGKAIPMIDKDRSIPLRSFASLCRLPGLTLISLQKGDGVEQLADLPPGMSVETLGVDFDAGPDAFLDSAAVTMNLDLVISCDTASAHLAGALGCPLWLVLNYMPEWRWMMDREDTPWYPTARLFRQTCRGDWNEVFERIAAELAHTPAAKEA